MIEALALLPPEVRYRIIGDGPERAALVALARQRGLGDRVEFTGQLDPEPAVRAAREGWLFVMPSTEEAFGVAYIEAMAAGIPAIGAAGEPGPAEIAAAGGGIELVPARDPGALTETIVRLLSDPERMAALGADARHTVEAEFTWEACGRRTLEVYRAVIACGRLAQTRIVHREQPLGGGGGDRADAPPDEPLGGAPGAVGGRPGKERVHRPPERIGELAGHPQAGVPGDGRDRGAGEPLDVADVLCDRRLLARRAERLSSSGTSTITRPATRAASASTATGSGTCSSTCESTARSNAPAS